MDWDFVRTPARRTAPPAPTRIEIAWRMRAPSGRVLECGIYLTTAGFEVRVGYHVDDPLATQYALTLDLARRNAETFREATAANPRFSILDGEA